MESRAFAIKGELRGQAQLLLWLAPAAVVVMLTIAVVNPPTGRDRPMFVSLLAVFIAAIPFALWIRSLFAAIIQVDETALTYRRGKKVTRILWREVRTLENHPVSKRLKVISVSGDVINVEYQFAGFQELAEIIGKRSGQSIVGLEQAAQPILQGNIEIVPPDWFRYAFFVLLPAIGYFSCVNFVVTAWRRHNAGFLLFAVVGAWAVVRGARNWWFRLGMRLRMDASGIHFQTRKESISARWTDISTAQLEHPDGRTWFIVRDRNDEPLLALKREFFNWSGGAMKRFDELAATARQRTVAPTIR